MAAAASPCWTGSENKHCWLSNKKTCALPALRRLLSSPCAPCSPCSLFFSHFSSLFLSAGSPFSTAKFSHGPLPTRTSFHHAHAAADCRRSAQVHAADLPTPTPSHFQVEMTPREYFTPLPGKDFWTPVDRTAVVRPVVGSDETTQDSQEILDSPEQHANQIDESDNDELAGLSCNSGEPDEEAAPEMESHEAVDGPSVEAQASARSAPEPSRHSGTSREARLLRHGQVETIDETGRRSIRTVGSPMDIWHIPDGERVVVQFNTSHQPIGNGGRKFTRIAGKVVRNGRFVPLRGNWRKLPNAPKDDMWSAIMRKFYLEPVHAAESIKARTLMSLGNKRRQHRYELKKKVQLTSGDTVQSVLDRARNKGLMFDAEDLEILVDRWLTKDDKDKADKAKTSRSQNQYLHTLGSKSIAQVADEMAEDMGETPNRDDMWCVTHTKKDGNPVTEKAGEAIAQIKAIIERQGPTERVCSQGSIYWSHNDACGQVFGHEHSGRVRGVGPGPTPGKSTSYTSVQRSNSSTPTPRERELVNEVESLKNLYTSQTEVIQEQSIKLKEQSTRLQEQSTRIQEQTTKLDEQTALYHAQQEEMANVKRMIEMLMKGKQPSMGNN